MLKALDYDEPGAALTVVLFHGYGADAHDLAPLRKFIPRRSPLRWVFPDAPGRMWWPIDERALMERRWDPEREPAGLAQTRERVMSFLESLRTPWDRLVLGGFSQGAMLAVDLTLRAPAAPAGLAALSASIITESKWRRLAGGRAGLRFFQTHGTYDEILPFELARRLEALLRDGGLQGELLSFEGGHMIPAEGLSALGAYLDGQARTAPELSEE